MCYQKKFLVLVCIIFKFVYVYIINKIMPIGDSLNIYLALLSMKLMYIWRF